MIISHRFACCVIFDDIYLFYKREAKDIRDTFKHTSRKSPSIKMIRTNRQTYIIQHRNVKQKQYNPTYYGSYLRRCGRVSKSYNYNDSHFFLSYR